jgi:hypothetical protein
MFYIATQGLLYSFSIKLLGVNLFAVLVGSLLLGVSTIFLSFMLNTAIYGTAYITTLENMLSAATNFFSMQAYSLWEVLTVLVMTKSVVVILVSTFAYLYSFSTLLERLKERANAQESSDVTIQTFNWKEALVTSLNDLRLKRFIFPFLFMGLLIFFFSHLSTKEFSFVMVRAFLLSWFGFVLARRINFLSIIEMLRRRGMGHWADSLESSLKKVRK